MNLARIARPAILLAALHVPAHAADAPPATLPAGSVATVNGVAIPQSRFELMLKDMVGRGQRDTTELRSAIKQDLINRELIMQEVKRIGLDKSPEAQLQMEVLQQNVLIQLFLQNQLQIGRAHV